MITAGFPAMGLGMEKAAADVLQRPPHSVKIGVFTMEMLLDMVVYGFITAGLCLANFTLVVFAFGNGNLGLDSNNFVGNGSETVFRARSATFATLTWLSLLLAIEIIHLRRSLFRMKPKSI